MSPSVLRADKTPGQLSGLCTPVALALMLMWEVDLESVENLNCIHVNIWISGGMIVCGGNCFGRDEKAITQILSPTAQLKGQTEVQGRSYHCHLDLSLQVSVCCKSCPLKCLTTWQEHLKTINRNSAYRRSFKTQTVILTKTAAHEYKCYSFDCLMCKCKQIHII